MNIEWLIETKRKIKLLNQEEEKENDGEEEDKENEQKN